MVIWQKVCYKVLNNGIESEKYIFNENQRNLLRNHLNIKTMSLFWDILADLIRIKCNFYFDILKELNDLGIKSKFVSADRVQNTIV